MTLSAVRLSTIAGRLVSGYVLDQFFAPYVAAALFLLPLVGVGILAAGLGGPAPFIAAIALGFGLGAEVDAIGCMVSRYLGLRSYDEIYGCLFAIFTVGTCPGPVLMGRSFDETPSYKLALAVFGVALVCASVSFANARSSSGGSVSGTLPFSCPLDATRPGKRTQRAAQSESLKPPDSPSDDARFGNVQHTAARRG